MSFIRTSDERLKQRFVDFNNSLQGSIVTNIKVGVISCIDAHIFKMNLNNSN